MQEKPKGTLALAMLLDFWNLKCCSFVFIDLGNPDAAAFAASAMHGHPFDSKHTFHINRFSDIERFANMDETYVEPKVEDYRPKVCIVHSDQYFKLILSKGTSPSMAG